MLQVGEMLPAIDLPELVDVDRGELRLAMSGSSMSLAGITLMPDAVCTTFTVTLLVVDKPYSLVTVTWNV